MRRLKILEEELQLPRLKPFMTKDKRFTLSKKTQGMNMMSCTGKCKVSEMK
jgi:hypothetical protein